MLALCGILCTVGLISFPLLQVPATSSDMWHALLCSAARTNSMLEVPSIAAAVPSGLDRLDVLDQLPLQ